ncbi:aminoglycoside phosphotransferase family protein [Amycolatopsis sp. YIM 10]|uniref:aminoglycoside phosphotransferase family protein n=1 Tax=Amycolatopsis sp. YIM 10 TaxID=2653857 RepID=UPI0012908803|nr:aminoglycoside phosphotransferase family protein [Amycolatopsis sp. YIM 10]QFU93416.1 Aminoglycoside/hydroxyurea antibiotic resistance kinase [Amycolatopsis sp. YIM 10]
MNIDVPAQLVESHGDGHPDWLAALPLLVTEFLDRWSLRPEGPTWNGCASLVLPVTREDGTPAALKLQPPTEENAGTALALRTWDGDGIVRLLEYDPDTSTHLLERLDESRPLSAVPDETTALVVLAELLARLTAAPAPAGMRQLADVAAAMLDQVPEAATELEDPAERQLLRRCAAATAEVLGEPGDRLLHWDLHYDNVLAGEREKWLAIDPEPLAGDPGFDLLPALDNRWDDVVATGDVPRAVLRRFDLLTEALGLDRQRAYGWSMARILQNSLWNVEDGETRLQPVQIAIAEALGTRS